MGILSSSAEKFTLRLRAVTLTIQNALRGRFAAGDMALDRRNAVDGERRRPDCRQHRGYVTERSFVINPATDVLLVFALFLTFWCILFNLLAFVGGWTRLARTYPAPAGFDGKRWRMQSGMLRFGMHYGNCLQIGANTRGLRIAVFFPFRPGHPPLYFPWADVAITYERRWLSRWARLKFAQEPSVPLFMSERLAIRIAEAVKEAGATP
jgi:hypothetical protein